MLRLKMCRLLSSCFILTWFLTSLCAGYRGQARNEKRECVKIDVPMCKDVGYNLTYMPNNYGHKNQFQAGLVIHQFWPLVEINCSPLLKHFVCSIYAPMCDPEFDKEIVPCQSFCEDIRDSCEHFMTDNGIDWPKEMKCSNFPTRENNRICMKPEGDSAKNTIGDVTMKPQKSVDVHVLPPPKVNFNRVTSGGGCGCLCQFPFIRSNVTNGELPPCVLPCKQYFFKKDQETFMSLWLGLWSILAFVATTIALLTFMIDRRRFGYIERPIVFISVCYLFTSFGYIIRLIYGSEIACDGTTKFIRYSATGPANCTAVFIMTYFFSNVAWIWWVVLSMNWFLSTGFKWSSDAISSYSHYFHFVAWIIPTVQTMAILAMAAIDGDPVSGLCSVGNHDNNTLTIFVIAPLLIYTMLSLSFFVAGIIAKFQVARVLKHDSSMVLKTTCKFISRVGVFTFALFMPVISLLGCHFYEHNNREQWEKSANCDCMSDKRKPHFYIYLFKYLMALSPGIIVGFWVLNAKTWESWKNLCKRMCTNSPHEKNSLLDRGVAL